MNTAAHLSRVPGTRAVPTTALKQTREAIGNLNTQQRVVVLLGEHGTGKNFAAAVAAKLDCELDAAELAVPSRGTSERELLRLLLEALEELPTDAYKLPFTDLLRAARALLADRPWLVIAHPSEHLTRRTAGLLRTLFDDTGSRLRLVLAGEEGTEALLDASFGLRILTRVRFKPLTAPELEPAVRRLHPILAEASSPVILLLDQNYAQGRLHAWANLAAAADAHRAQTGDALTQEVAVRLLGRLGAPVQTRRRWGRAAA